MKTKKSDILVPLDVPGFKRNEYIKNYRKITKNSGKLMLFAGDQKVEHLNYDFFGKGIDKSDSSPKHLFEIASKAKVGCFAAQFGLITRYAMDYKNVDYLVKLNSKTGLVKTEQKDPVSEQWIDIAQVARLKRETGLSVVGVGYTIYLGSEYESEMLREAAQIVYEAHREGLVVVLWMYPRGVAVKDEKDPHLIAGAAGVAACLGSDFVKVSYPQAKNKKSEEILKEAIVAAGRTKVVCAGGSSVTPKQFLETLEKQLQAGVGGNATGRNIHQKNLDEAIKFCNAIYAMTVEGISAKEASKLL